MNESALETVVIEYSEALVVVNNDNTAKEVWSRYRTLTTVILSLPIMSVLN